MKKPEEILPAYGLMAAPFKVEPFGSGLINHTWKISSPEESFILQRVNHAIFKEPGNIAHNIRMIAVHLRAHHPRYPFIAPMQTLRGEEMVYEADYGFYRLFPFVPGSHSKDVVETPAQAFQAATQFGRFTRLLQNIDVAGLKVTIPCFHDLGLRYQQFLQALEKGNRQRIDESAQLIRTLVSHADIVTEYNAIIENPEFRLRVTHHDTKISNVLFDDNGKGICVIDLDTVMPGYFISDVGDMMRTYLSPVSEEESDFKKIVVRSEFYKAIVQGYYNEMKDQLTDTEKNYFFYAGTFMIYMQALRFLTDYLNLDIYYGARYPRHNYVRASNQLVLLEKLLEKKGELDVGY